MIRTIALAIGLTATFGLVGAVRLGHPADAAPPPAACGPFDPPCAPPTTVPGPPTTEPCSIFDPACVPPTTEAPPRTPRHIYIPEHYAFPFNAQPGDTVTVIMDPGDDFLIEGRCSDLGGTMNDAAFTATGVYYCDGVRF